MISSALSRSLGDASEASSAARDASAQIFSIAGLASASRLGVFTHLLTLSRHSLTKARAEVTAFEGVDRARMKNIVRKCFIERLYPIRFSPPLGRGSKFSR